MPATALLIPDDTPFMAEFMPLEMLMPPMSSPVAPDTAAPALETAPSKLLPRPVALVVAAASLDLMLSPMLFQVVDSSLSMVSPRYLLTSWKPDIAEPQPAVMFLLLS